jgi:hypothetical protein
MHDIREAFTRRIARVNRWFTARVSFGAAGIRPLARIRGDAEASNGWECRPSTDPPPRLRVNFFQELSSSREVLATPSLLTATITPAGIDSPTIVGAHDSYGAAAAAITTRGQQGLTLTHPANDSLWRRRACLPARLARSRARTAAGGWAVVRLA